MGISHIRSILDPVKLKPKLAVPFENVGDGGGWCSWYTKVDVGSMLLSFILFNFFH